MIKNAQKVCLFVIDIYLFVICVVKRNIDLCNYGEKLFYYISETTLSMVIVKKMVIRYVWERLIYD